MRVGGSVRQGPLPGWCRPRRSFELAAHDASVTPMDDRPSRVESFPPSGPGQESLDGSRLVRLADQRPRPLRRTAEAARATAPSRSRKRARACRSWDGGRAAAYLSSYFVIGKGRKATLQENARNPHLPRMLIWVSPTLTGATGITMRNLRRCRQLWAVRLGLIPPPSWSGTELARVVLLAGPWPSRPTGGRRC